MPNGEDRKLKFVVKIRDPETDEFKPIYIAPDATDSVRGDVKLSDAIDSNLNAAEGMTAATPKAVKDVADKKVDKETKDPQGIVSDFSVGGQLTVTGESEFSGKMVAQKGITVPEGETFTGNLTGTADKAKQLDIAEDVGSTIEPVYFSGGKPVACGDYLGVTVVSKTKPEGEQVLFWIEPEEKDKRLEG